MQRIVSSLPLAELWDEAGAVVADEVRHLAAEDIRNLLRSGPVRFVVADVGSPLRWVPASDGFRFWKAEAWSRMAGSGAAYLEAFPGSYCYFASEWRPVEGPPIVVLAVAH